MNVEKEQFLDLQRRILRVTSRMEQDMKINDWPPKRISNPLITKLQTLSTIIDPHRPFVCSVVGNINRGKSSLINEICRTKVCHSGEYDKEGTKRFQRIDVPEMNAIFFKIVEFGSNDDFVLSRRIKNDFKETLLSPDVILFVVTKDDLCDQNALQRISTVLNELLESLKQEQSQGECPVVFVLNKIEDYFRGTCPTLNEGEIVDAHLTNAVAKMNQYLCTKVKSRIAVSSRYRYDIDHLSMILNMHSPLNAQIISKKHSYFVECRKTIASKIISSFTMATAAISAFPVVDIRIVMMMEKWMFEMLSCFSVDPSRTIDTFKKEQRADIVVQSSSRRFHFKMSNGIIATGVTFLASAGLNATAVSLTTAASGWACYNHVTNEDQK